MQKIVIMSSQPDKDNPLLVAMLNVLFPECEIQVTPESMETEYSSGESVSGAVEVYPEFN